MNNEEIQKLNKEIELLKQQLSAKYIKNENLQSEVNWLSDQLTLFRKARFASTSEKTKIYEQMELDFGNEAEMEADPNESEEKIRITYDRKKKAKKRKVNLQLEPDRTIIVDIDSSEKIDPDTGKPLECIGTRKHRELVHHKEYYEIIEYVQYRYAKKDQETGETEVICKPIPTSVLPQSYASSSILASVIEKKYAMHVPLYRQEQLYHRQGLELSRQTMANWIIALYNNYFDLFIEHMHSELLKATHIMCDETTQKIVMIKHNEGRENCYVWVYMPNRGEDKKFVIYQFEHDRKQERVQEYLKGYSGVITSDGYSAYSSVDNVVQANCWAHCRRYYTRVLDTAGKNVNLKETVTWKLVNKINELFSLEDQCICQSKTDQFSNLKWINKRYTDYVIGIPS